MEIEDRDLIGLEYPGRVENVDNMVKTIGGLTNLSKVVNNFEQHKQHIFHFKKQVYFYACFRYFI